MDLSNPKLQFDNIYHKNYSGRVIFTKDGMSWEAGGVEHAKEVVPANLLVKVDCLNSSRKFQIRFFVRLFEGDEKTNVKLFTGFRKHNIDEVSSFVSDKWGKEFEVCKTSSKGWISGEINLKKHSLEFSNDNEKCFHVYYSDMEQCNSVKNDLVIELKDKNTNFEHETVSAIRFQAPSSTQPNFVTDENSQNGNKKLKSASSLSKEIISRAELTFSVKNAVVKFPNILLLTPRGRYEVGLSRELLYLHGKTYSFKVKLSDLAKMFLLPSGDGHFLVIYLKKPLNQGKTFYPFVILKFSEEETVDVAVDMAEEEMKEKYDSKLTKQMEGEAFKVVTRVLKTLSKTKVFLPGTFSSAEDKKFFRCALKASPGLLFPLEASLVFCHKPVVYIQHSEIESVSFLRLINSVNNTKMFDLGVKLRRSKKRNQPKNRDQNVVFTGIEKKEFSPLFEFLSSKGVTITDKEIHEKRIKTARSGKRSCRATNSANFALLSSSGGESSSEESDEEKALSLLDKHLRHEDIDERHSSEESNSEEDVEDIDDI